MKVLQGRLPALAVGAVGLGAAFAFALPAGAAVSVQSQSPPVPTSVSLGNRAVLDADGAVVFPSVRVVCAPGSRTFLNVIVSENVGHGRIAKGSGFIDDFACTGRAETFRVAVTPDNGRAFKTGTAFGQLNVSVCQFNCDNLRDEHNIQIVKK